MFDKLIFTTGTCSITGNTNLKCNKRFKDKNVVEMFNNSLHVLQSLQGLNNLDLLLNCFYLQQ